MKSKYIKGIMLGLCISALSSSVVFAQEVSSNVTAINVVAEPEGTKELMEKQRQIDQYLFEDHAKDLEAKDIFVNYTSIAGDSIEIGISPYNDENANYLYDALGKDGIKIVEFDQSVIYQSGVAVDGAAVEDGKMYKGGDVEIQENMDEQTGTGDMTVTDAQGNTENVAVPYTTTDTKDVAVKNVKNVSTPETIALGGQNTEKTNNTAYFAFIVVAVAGIGGLGTIIIRSNAKKSMK